MAETYTKAKLIAELASATSSTKAGVGRMLDRLTEIAYREAANGFVIPGICKLKVVTKKASRRRNPITGQIFLIGERHGLKVVPLKKAKMAIVPNKDVVVQLLEEPPPEVQIVSEPSSAEPMVPPPPPATSQIRETTPTTSNPALTATDDGQIVFPCSECGSMLAAPPKMSGEMGSCPFCNTETPIPHRQSTDVRPEHQSVGAPRAGSSVSDFILFVCHACSQEIEAPTDMVGMNVECPTCATSLTVPIAASNKPPHSTQELAGSEQPSINRSSMTIRIDLSDLE
jgi:nucleoid DNA-binding protein